MKQPKQIKDRSATEKRILDVVGQIIAEEGFERLNVSTVAQRANISRMIIYRYFGSLEELIVSYTTSKNFWANTTINPEHIDNVGQFVKSIFRAQIKQLRDDVILKRLCRWELFANNEITINSLASKEANGTQFTKMLATLANVPHKEAASLAAILSGAVNYLILIEDITPTYIGIDLRSNEGWDQIADGIDTILDLWLANIKNK